MKPIIKEKAVLLKIYIPKYQREWVEKKTRDRKRPISLSEFMRILIDNAMYR